MRVPCPSSTGIAGNIIGKSVTELRSGDSMGSGRKQRDSVRERTTARVAERERKMGRTRGINGGRENRPPL